ncbi:carbohydrate-binding domain-containing protein, partial [Arthrobacter deserti]|nr:carbohydrate-binding domain-containing protein [Arthrobacter deserti]
MTFPSQIGRITSVAALALALALSGCSARQAAVPATPSGQVTPSGTAAATADGTGTAAVSAELAASIAAETHFDEDDLAWDAADGTRVSLAGGSSSAEGTDASAVAVDGNTITIGAAGTYRLSGSLADGQVVVAAGEEDVVRIVLVGAAITSGTGAPFAGQSANEVLVYLDDGTASTLTDAKAYADGSEDAPSAALYSMADLTIAGPGELAVTGNYADGIASKAGLVLASGTVTVDPADDGIKGKDYLALLDGDWLVTAGG